MDRKSSAEQNERPSQGTLPTVRPGMSQQSSQRRISCPMCKKPISVNYTHSGLKMACPHCGQRLKVPIIEPPAPVPTDRTMLAEFEPTGPLSFSLPPPAVPPSPPAASGPPPAMPPPPTQEMLARPHSLRCMACGCDRCYIEKKVTQQGITTMLILLLVFFPLFWIGLLQQEEMVVCPRCGAQRPRRFGAW